MDFTELLKSLVPVVGQLAVDKLAQELQELSGGQDGWKKAVLALVADAVDKHGMAGIDMALQAIEDLRKGKTPEISWADLRTASDILAELQNAEADRKSAAKDFLIKVSKVLALVLSAIVKGLLTK